MRAAVIVKQGGPEGLKVQQIEEPSPTKEEVLVAVKATALNRADLAQRRGQYPAPPGIRQDVPGLEMAGVVIGLGEGVQGVQMGTRVMGLLGGAGYAEKVVIHSRMLLPIPDNLTFPEAASLPEVYFTSYDALFNQCALTMRESVLIHAAGSGVGTAAIQLARLVGAKVFGTVGSFNKLGKAVKLGLDVGINYQEQEFEEVVHAHTDGLGVNVILDVIGGPYFNANLRSLASRGRLVLVGSMGGSQVETNLALLSSKRLRIHGTVLRARPLEEKIALSEQIKQEILPHFETGKLRPVVDRIFGLEEVAEAHEYMETNQNFGKIVLSLE